MENLENLREVGYWIKDIEPVGGSIKIRLFPDKLSKHDMDRDFRIHLRIALSEFFGLDESEDSGALDEYVGQIFVNSSNSSVLMAPYQRSLEKDKISGFLWEYAGYLAEYSRNHAAEYRKVYKP